MSVELSLQTPALLFPALSLLILAYTNKFLAIAKLIRNLYSTHQDKPQPLILAQISSLRTRLNLIRWMQAFGLASNFFCVVTMFFIYLGHPIFGHVVFFLALILLMLSLTISVIETFLSAGALNVLLRNLEEKEGISVAKKTVKKIGSIFTNFRADKD
ncbi:MAG: hypothetical protein RIR11_284 [Bacteroidota bacterium]|jgi:hypothetical protein